MVNNLKIKVSDNLPNKEILGYSNILKLTETNNYALTEEDLKEIQELFDSCIVDDLRNYVLDKENLEENKNGR